MKKINIDKINMKFYNGNYIYIVSILNEEIVIKRIDVVNNNIILININNFNIKSYPKTNDNLELDYILTDIINNLRNYHMLYDVIDIDKLESVLKSKFECKI